MAIQEFGYTPSQATTNFTPIMQSSSPANIYMNQKSTAADDINNIMSAAVNVGKAVVQSKAIDKEEQDKQNKLKYLDVSAQYRDAKSAYIEKLSEVKYDATLYNQHLEQFKAYTQEISKDLTPEYQDSFRQSADQFSMYQGFAVEELQKQENKDKYTDLVTSLMLDTSTLNTAERTKAITSTVDSAGQFGVDKKTAQELVLRGQINAMLVKFNSETDLNYNTVDTMKNDINNIINMYPNLKNSKEHIEGLSKISGIEKGIDNEYQGKMQLAMTTGDYNSFKNNLQVLQSRGVVDKETSNLYKQKYAKMNVNEEAVANNLATSLYSKYGNGLNIEALENTGQVDSKTARYLKKMVTANAEKLIAEGKDYGNIKALQTNNPSIFNSIVNRQAKEVLNNYMTVIDNPKITDDDRAGLILQFNQQANYYKNFGASVNRETLEDFTTINSILKNPKFKGKVGETFIETKNSSYKEVNINDKEFIKATEDLKLSASEIESARKLYSIQKHLGVDVDENKTYLESIYSPRVINDTVKVSSNLSSVVKNAQPTQADDFIIPTLQNILTNSNMKEQAAKIQVMLDSGKEISMDYIKGSVVLKSGIDQVMIPMSNQKRPDGSPGLLDVYNSELAKAYGKPPGAVSQVLDYVYSDILIENTINRYLIGASGEVFFNALDNAGQAISENVKGIANETGMLLDNYINNFNKTMEKANKAILEGKATKEQKMINKVKELTEKNKEK